LLRCGIADHIVQHGSTQMLLQNEGLDSDEISNRVQGFVEGLGARD
jgi:deoxyxylulose-5-phosphate synthase